MFMKNILLCLFVMAFLSGCTDSLLGKEDSKSVNRTEVEKAVLREQNSYTYNCKGGDSFRVWFNGYYLNDKNIELPENEIALKVGNFDENFYRLKKRDDNLFIGEKFTLTIFGETASVTGKDIVQFENCFELPPAPGL